MSGVVPPGAAGEVARGSRPRLDYLELVRALDADLLDVGEARRRHPRIAPVLERAGGTGLLVAWACFRLRQQYDAVLTDGEHVGIPLALLLKLVPAGRRRPRHLMIVHILSVPKKLPFFDLLRVQSHIDRFLVYATRQKEFLQQRWGLSDERVVLTHFMVDSRFFAAERCSARRTERPTVCAVGLEARDYPTLLDAVEGLAADVVVAAASPWSRRSDGLRGRALPDNVTVQRLSQYELRQLYADSSLLVMPLHDVAFQAGVTAVLEAMSMRLPVVCTRTPGQTDVVVDGVTGVYVPPRDPAALRAAITALLADPGRRRRMGAAGRARVEAEMELDVYVSRLAALTRATVDGSADPARGQDDRSSRAATPARERSSPYSRALGE